MTPATPYDARGLLKSAFKDNNPVMFIEHSLLYGLTGPVPEEDYTVPIGSADIKREGKDVTIIAYLRMVHVALEAAEALAGDGIDAEVVDLRSLRPLDMDTVVQSVRRTHKAVMVEEGWKTGGFGAEVASGIMSQAFDDLDGPVERVAGKEVPMPYNRELEQAAIPTYLDVVQTVKSLL